MELVIRNNCIFLGEIEFHLEDLFSSEFYRYSDSLAVSYNIDSFLVNELFLYIIQPFLALDYFVYQNNVNKIDVSKAEPILALYLTDIAKKRNILLIRKRKLLCDLAYSQMKGFLQVIATYFYICYLMVKIPYYPNNISWPTFTIIRDKASLSKLKGFDIHKENEDPWARDSVYRYFSKITRIRWVSKSFIAAVKELYTTTVYAKIKLGNYSSALVPKRYGKRLLHTYLFYFMLDALFEKNKYSTHYTGLNLDRFSVIVDKLAEKHNLKTICIPHGLEYGFKFPKGFSSKLFYTTSANAARHLNDVYNCDKFIFNQVVAEKMFKIKTSFPEKVKQLVFFTEPREPFVNIDIIRNLLPLLRDVNIELNIKHHPGDNIKDYVEFNGVIKVINNLEEALTNNICFARKSTTLIEALYNGSKVAAIITNNKDKSIFNTFPSLQDGNISVVYDVNALFKWIVSEYIK